MIEDIKNKILDIQYRLVNHNEIISFEDLLILTNNHFFIRHTYQNYVLSTLKNTDEDEDYSKLLITCNGLSSVIFEFMEYQNSFYENINKNDRLVRGILLQCDNELTQIENLKKEDNSEIENLVPNRLFLLEQSSQVLYSFINQLRVYVTDFNFKNQIETGYDVKIINNNVLDARKKYNLTNNERLKALKEFCPELIAKLHRSDLKRDEKGQIINLITGVNKTDGYKKIMTADSKEIEKTEIKNDEIDFERLKSKLNNT